MPLPIFPRMGSRASTTWLLLIAAIGSTSVQPERCLALSLHVQGIEPIFGGADSVVADSQGEFAYVTNGPGLVTIDVTARSATQITPTNSSSALAGDLDETDSLVALYEFSRAWVTDIATGEEVVSTGASAAQGVAVAAGFMYVPSFNNRGIYVRSLDGLVSEFINPTGGSPVALPCAIARSPDRTRVFVGDDQNEVIYVLDAVTRQVASTLLVGAPTCNIVALDADHLVVVDHDSDQAALFDLTDPSGLPEQVGFVGDIGFVRRVLYDALDSTIWVLDSSEIIVLALPDLAEVARVVIDPAVYGHANDAAVVASPGDVRGLVTTDRGVVFVPEPSRWSSSLASVLALGLLAKRTRKRVPYPKQDRARALDH